MHEVIWLIVLPLGTAFVLGTEAGIIGGNYHLFKKDNNFID